VSGAASCRRSDTTVFRSEKNIIHDLMRGADDEEEEDMQTLTPQPPPLNMSSSFTKISPPLAGDAFMRPFVMPDCPASSRASFSDVPAAAAADKENGGGGGGHQNCGGGSRIVTGKAGTGLGGGLGGGPPELVNTWNVFRHSRKRVFEDITKSGINTPSPPPKMSLHRKMSIGKMASLTAIPLFKPSSLSDVMSSMDQMHLGSGSQ
jgi:hypothetical protein